ncbi:MAG: hypothetical protein ACP5HQ_01575 [Thermoprotei archaeon]
MRKERKVGERANVGVETPSTSIDVGLAEFVDRLHLDSVFSLNLEMFDDVSRFISLVIPSDASLVVLISSPMVEDKLNDIEKWLKKHRPDVTVMKMFHEGVKNNEIIVGFK